LDEVRQKLNQNQTQEVQAEVKNDDTAWKIESLKEAISDTIFKTDEQTLTRHSYNHMLERMKKDFIAAKINSSDNDAALKNKSIVLDLEQ